MDKPLDRQPDKRHAAYESIFGRPIASHHQGLPQSSYPQSLQPQATNQPYMYQQHQYQGSLERKPSMSPPFAPSTYSQQLYPTQQQHVYRQSYYPSTSAQQSYPPDNSYPIHLQGSYEGSSILVSPPSDHGPTRSTSSKQYASGTIASQPEEPPDPNNQALIQSGLTPAQAYQAQVYRNSPSGPQYRRSSPAPPARIPTPPSQNGKQNRPPDLPRLGLSIEYADGRLGVDFRASGNSSDHNSSDPGTDDGSNELPWTRKDRSPLTNRQEQPSQHQQPQQTSHIQQGSLAGNSHRLSGASDRSAPRAPRLPVDITPPPTDSAVSSSSPTSSTLVDQSSIASTRRSSDSSRTLPRLPGSRREGTVKDRSMSMSAAPNSMRNLIERNRSTRPPIPSLPGGRHSPSSWRMPTRKSPIVYPALLSRVAEAFRNRIIIGDRVKDGLTYKDAFDGREAVDKIAYIIKTADRNLALLLGRALDAQKFFHDVTYDHRLRDSAHELYQFRTKLPSPFVSGEIPSAEVYEGEDGNDSKRPVLRRDSSAEDKDDSAFSSPATPLHPQPRRDSVTADEIPLPSGVFTLLTDCYSPTCSRDQLCYSIACPRRLEQQARLNMKPQPGLSKQISKESLGDVQDAGTLWIHSVPQEIINSVSDTEKKRQEAINEVIYTERDFVRDMEYLRDCWINRLKDQDIIPQSRRTDFLAQVFWNIHDIIAVNTRLRDALNKRQKLYAVVERIGDILLDAVPHFGPFVSYGAHQLYGKYEFEKEKNANPAFAQFVEATERLPESRKLELNAYLTKPTTRLARYPLLLEAVLKHTPDDSHDKIVLPQVVAIIREFLARVNTESGKTENRFNLLQLDQQLVFKQGEEVDLRLKEEGRQLVYKSPLNKRDGELQVYLFDHALLFTKQVKVKQVEQYKVYRRPIPLELLLISAPDDVTATVHARTSARTKQSLMKKASVHNKGPSNLATVTTKLDSKGQNWITFVHLGRKYYNLTLWATTPLSQQKWLEHIIRQQGAMRSQSMIFDTVTLSEGFFSGPNKVNCAAPYNGGRRVVYGTDDGVYISDLRNPTKEPVKVLALLDVLQVDVLEDYQLLIVLSERQVLTFPLDALDPYDPMAGLKRAKRISSHTSFFKAGFCLGRVLVCIVKSSQLSSTFKTLEPIDQNIRGRSKPTFRKLLQGGNDTLKLFREFYIPVESTSIHYLKTKLCVGCTKGFEIVDLESLDTQGLLDPLDESLEFVRKRESLRPLAIYRIANEFLLCYDEFAFYVNKNGRRSRKDFMVHWEGSPTGFALHEPFVLAFEPSFVEIRHIVTGMMSQVIQGSNLRLLFADTPPSVTNTGGSMHHNAYHPGPEHNQYGPHHSSDVHGSRGPAYVGYGPPPHVPHSNHYPRNPQGIGRDEILIVSDDRVLALRTAAGPQRFMSDDAYSMAGGSG